MVEWFHNFSFGAWEVNSSTIFEICLPKKLNIDKGCMVLYTEETNQDRNVKVGPELSALSRAIKSRDNESNEIV